MASEELKPCPFCGDEAFLNESHKDHFRVECGECGAAIATWHARDNAKEAAAEEWNTRNIALVDAGAEGWQPIETAPRDGRQVIVAIPRGNDWEYGVDFWSCGGWAIFIPDAATHWMRPAAPKPYTDTDDETQSAVHNAISNQQTVHKTDTMAGVGEKAVLPYDVEIGSVRFNKGVSLDLLISRATAWYYAAAGRPQSDTVQVPREVWEKVIAAMDYVWRCTNVSNHDRAAEKLVGALASARAVEGGA